MNEKQLKQINQAGFTLTEMLVVIALIGIVLGLIGPQIMGRFSRAKVDSTKIQIRQLGTVLDQFRLDCGFYPTTEMTLKALIQKPEGGGRECKNYDPEGYIKGGHVPKDGFNNDFVYTSDGNTYEIISRGNDNAEGGEGLNADISSKNLDE